MTYAFDYIVDNGIATQTEYPYKGRDQKCAKTGGAKKISGYTEVPEGNCDA